MKIRFFVVGVLLLILCLPAVAQESSNFQGVHCLQGGQIRWSCASAFFLGESVLIPYWNQIGYRGEPVGLSGQRG